MRQQPLGGMSMATTLPSRHHGKKLTVLLIASAIVSAGASAALAAEVCGGQRRMMHASVVALDQPMMINRLGSNRPSGMMYALLGDVVRIDPAKPIGPGNVQLRPDKRPRPLVLRVNVYDCLQIDFHNYLTAAPSSAQQPVTRTASIHVTGLEPAVSIADDGFDAGSNPDGQVAPGRRRTYTLYAPAEGTFLLYSPAGDFNGFGQTQQMAGLFGAVHVEPAGAEWYRAQVTHADLQMAMKKDPRGLRRGLPTLDYNARYPDGPRKDMPILRMTDGNEIVHSDLTALITGPNAGRFPPGSRPTANPALLPDREAPFREITSIYSESLDLVQAFPDYYTNSGTNLAVSGGGDGFAINYGASGIVNEILANRLKIGPSADCVECKFEEFFLSSWPNGDPGILVDAPANVNCVDNWLSNLSQANTNPNPPSTASVSVSSFTTTKCRTPETPRIKPTKAYFPDDPSNVYHGYLGDHVIFRVLHAGVSVHHVHHHHAHQWLFSPDKPGSNYLDSQAIGPGSSFSMELVYAGAGNQNLTAGDLIFHCHFYPHFASGMWALFRVHDTLELGTALDADGRPLPGSRALPDPEIATGTPTPAVVPLPTIAMAPIPGEVAIVDGQVRFPRQLERNPGYPFFVPGVAGHRAPHPPMAFAKDKDNVLDGGLPRHLIVGGRVSTQVQSQTDYTKNLDLIDAVRLPEAGTVVEQLAMKAHEQRRTRSATPEGRAADFIQTGAPRASGAPFANPIPTDVPVTKRVYKGADIQVDAVFNKAGWHYPQQRMMALWEDVKRTVNGIKPPEPLFVRANNGEVVEYWQTNLVPSYYELDDYQVRTPTDIIGQHIHLVKFDVLAADGAANGFNYEDGTFSAQEVRDRINAINANGGLCEPRPGMIDTPRFCPPGSLRSRPIAKPIPGLEGPTPGSREWYGAQATVRLWYVDPLKDLDRERSYMTVFTHDHFSPSTHQEAGLYGGLLIEPRGSTWTKPDGTALGVGRDDGGPTSYAANILPPAGSAEKSYREFALAWADTQLVYNPTSKSQPDCYPTGPTAPNCKPLAPGATYTGWSDPANATNPAFSAVTGAAQPLVIADFGSGTFSMNYRNEPLPLRLQNPIASNTPASDTAFAYASIAGRNAQFSVQPTGGGKINSGCTSAPCFTFPQERLGAGMQDTDPYTPLLRAYPGDPVQVRLLAGGFTTMHDVITHGLPWKFEPYAANSGWRSSQLILLSEHFEMHLKMPRPGDYLYSTSASYEGMTNGLWGLMRAYPALQGDLQALPSNPQPAALAFEPPAVSPDCSATPGIPCLRRFNVTALTIGQALGPNGSLVYNGRGLTLTTGFAPTEILNDPQAIIYVRTEDLVNVTAGGCTADTRLKAGLKVEPLVLRVAAGDVVQVTLHNCVDPNAATFTTPISGARPGVPYSNPFAGIKLFPSTNVGLHPQLLAFDVRTQNGINVGQNPTSTVPPGRNITYTWYAGTLEAGPDGKSKATPVEFGALNLMPADPLNHPYRGLFGGLVVEPAGSTWTEDPDSHMSATVFPTDGALFRDFVVIGQDDVDILLNGKSNYVAGNALSAVNYRTEPAIYRYGQLLENFPNSLNAPIADWSNLTLNIPPPPGSPSGDLVTLAGISWANVDTSKYIANSLVGGDPETPIFRAPAGMPVRFRLLHAGGNGDNQQVFELSGHSWQAEPYLAGSTVIGFNKASPVVGVTSGYGVTSHFDVVIAAAGGAAQVPGDYVYRTWTADQFQVGVWGLFRVGPSPTPGVFADTVAVTRVARTDDGKFKASGHVTIRPARNAAERTRAPELRLTIDGATTSARVDADGRWEVVLDQEPGRVEAVSPHGGVGSWTRAAPPPLVELGVAAAQAQPVVAPSPPPRTRIPNNRRRVGLGR